MTFADISQTQCGEITTPDGEHVECVIITIAVPVSEIAGALDEYVPENGNHPLASQAKPIAKTFLDALIAWSQS
tara:strand:- start:604 stop:825 length:222 start_codon:yes stop_codon:yes gene_type:complete